tara:strand:+ start:304 stop:444 length:141 start_codon:yes stop_codon:yes gene_type:complete
MKTRLTTNKKRDSYRLDIIENGQLYQYYFTEFKKAIDFQNKKLKHK